MCVRNDENVNGIIVPNALSTVDNFVGFEKYALLYISVISVTHTLKRGCAKGRKKFTLLYRRRHILISSTRSQGSNLCVSQKKRSEENWANTGNHQRRNGRTSCGEDFLTAQAFVCFCQNYQ